jgi:phospholipid transport system substrate-binding protein
VSSQVARPGGGPPIRIDWRVTDYGGSYKINDVVVDGVSMAITERSEFASVIQRNGGSVQDLLTMLRAKTADAAGG